MARLWIGFNKVPAAALLSIVATSSVARAQFTGHYTGNVSIKNQFETKYNVAATVEIIPRTAGGVLVTLRDGTYNPSMVAFFNGVFLEGQDTLGPGVFRTLQAGSSITDPNALLLQICLGPSTTSHRCDIREFIFEGPLSPYGACVSPPSGACQQIQEFFCIRGGGTYLGDDPSLCALTGACTVSGVCSLKTSPGCSLAGGNFHGVGTTCPPPGATIRWTNPSSGDYGVPENWDPAQVPVSNGLRSDTAIFDLATGGTIPISTTGATAGRWEILNSSIAVSGDATLSYPFGTPPSLAVGFGGRLSYDSGFFTSQSGVVGSGEPQARVTLNPNTIWFNLGSLSVGGNIGPGLVELGENALLSVGGGAAFGNGGEGELRVLAGALAQFQGSLLIGSVSGGEARVSVSGRSATRPSRLQATGFTIIGTLSPSPVPAVVIAENGGELSLNGGLSISDSTADASSAVVTIDGEDSQATIAGALIIGDFASGDLLIKNAGTVTCDVLNLGTQIAGSDGQLRIEGLDSGLIVNQAVNIGGTGGHGEVVLTEGTNFDATDFVAVGNSAGGSLSVAAGAQATCGNGLFIHGQSNGGGSVIITGLNASLNVTGTTEIGSGSAGSRGHLTIRNQAGAVLHGNLFIDHEGPGPLDAALSVFSGAVLDVEGDIAVGVSQPGDMIVSSSAVECDQIAVGSNTAGASGYVILEPGSLMYVEDAQVGGNGGFGLMRIDAGSTLSMTGDMHVGGALGGLVTVNGEITGPGIVFADSGAIVNGTGRIIATKFENGGTIAPGLSPGTLTIEGEYEQLPGGRLEIEYAGTDAGQFDRLVVAGEAYLGGTLEIQFVAGFSAPDPDKFVLSQAFVEAKGGIFGDFNERVFVYPDLFADFDDDGDKDLRDVAAFANCLRESGELSEDCLRADWERDGVIGRRENRELSVRLNGPQ